MVYHPGELEVQKRAGVRAAAEENGDSILDFIPPRARDFLERRPFALLGTVDRENRVWASVVTGNPGFISVAQPRLLRIGALPPAGDPLRNNLKERAHAAVLAIDLMSPRRVRLNGFGVIDDGAIFVWAQQVYGNCRRYIQERVVTGVREPASGPADVAHAAELSEHQRDLIAGADTFFIASDHPGSGADVSHKGGAPGFVQVIDSRHLSYPDYNGNSMFNTLGNLSVNPRAGLLFIDFDRGATVQLTGQASVDWSPERARGVAGAERMVDFQIEEIIGNEAGFPLLAKLRQYSQFNPKR